MPCVEGHTATRTVQVKRHIHLQGPRHIFDLHFCVFTFSSSLDLLTLIRRRDVAPPCIATYFALDYDTSGSSFFLSE